MSLLIAALVADPYLGATMFLPVSSVPTDHASGGGGGGGPAAGQQGNGSDSAGPGAGFGKGGPPGFDVNYLYSGVMITRLPTRST